MTNELFSRKQQEALATERKKLVIALEDDPTSKQRMAANQRVAEIDAQSKMDGYLSSKCLKPPT